MTGGEAMCLVVGFLLGLLAAVVLVWVLAVLFERADPQGRPKDDGSWL